MHQGTFTSHSLAEVFRDLYLGEVSGILTLSSDETEKRIFFERGLIHYAESAAPEEELGSCLLAEGKLSAGALDEARRETRVASELGQVLLNRGLISRPPLRETVRSIIESVMRSVFRWDAGISRVTETAPGSELFDADVLTTFETILEGIFSMTGFDPVHDAMLGLDNNLRLRKPSPVPLERLTLSPAHGYIISRLDGSTDMKGVLSILPEVEEDQASRFLFGLLVMGVVEYDPRLGDGPFRVGNILRDHADRRALEKMQEQTIQQVYKQTQTRNLHEVLGVGPGASRQAVEQAYEEAKGLFSRERLLPAVRERYRSELTVIESRLIEAFLRLTQPQSNEALAAASLAREEATSDVGVSDLLVRPEMDKTKSKLAMEEAGRIAESYYGKALRAIRDGDFHNAIQYGKLAISYNDEDARFYFMLADCQNRNPGARWQHQAEQNFTRAAQLDPWNAEYLVCLGRFYKKRGLKLRARKQFEEALKLVPSHEIAARELETLGS